MRSIRLGLWLVPFLIAGTFALRNLATWPARINYPGTERYEGIPLTEMVHLRQGIPLYAVGARDGFDGATYGPLYYLLGAHLINPAKLSYLPLRMLSVFAMLGCAFCCGTLTFWLTGNRCAAWLSPIVFLAYGMVTGLGILGLSDALALLLAFSAFLAVYRFRRGSGLLFAVPLMVLSFFYKPQYVAGPVAVLLFLLLERRYRLAAEFVGLLAVCGTGLLVLFQYVIFGGQEFLRHFLFYQAPLLSWYRFTHETIVIFAFLLFLPLILAVEYLRERGDKLISCYLLVAVVLGLVTYSKGGSDIHYFFESVFLVSALVPALLSGRLALPAYPVDVVVILGIMLLAGQWHTEHAPRPTDVARYDAIQALLRHDFHPHAVGLSVVPGEFVQAGLKVPFSDLFQVAQLSRNGVLPDANLVNQIQNHRFAVIALNFDVEREANPYWSITPRMAVAIQSDYRLEKSLAMPTPVRERDQDRFYVYVPRPTATTLRFSRRVRETRREVQGASAKVIRAASGR